MAVNTEEVKQTPIIAPPNRILSDRVTTTANTLGNPGDGQLSELPSTVEDMSHGQMPGYGHGRTLLHNGRFASCIVASLLLTALSLAFAEFDSGAVLCVGIALVSALSLVVLAVVKKKGKQRTFTLTALAVYLFASLLLLTHYSLVRDHVRWLFLSGGYKAKVLVQPAPANEEFRHAEWDGWGFLDETTAFLVFDPTNSLAGALGAKPPVKARGLPCDVFRVRRLDSHWYAVLFYTDTYWGQGDCR